MLSPKKTKYRKAHKGRIGGIQANGGVLHFGTYGIMAEEPARITARQIEACRIAISRKMRRIGKLWIRIFPDIPVSAKPAEVRMGKGKGSVEYWMCRVKAGKVLFEIDGVPAELARTALEAGASKLPISIKQITVEKKERREV
uniref:Ribosomal protein L16 n=1 Tax=Andalucia godoyi TaxID=505711 RepID=M4Q988_ANDGO|nr:ribosomal protein L16 [Andalucia godoyi]AGH23982.1 ribosomal protein L16 [Andalucia godoyi]